MQDPNSLCCFWMMLSEFWTTPQDVLLKLNQQPIRWKGNACKAPDWVWWKKQDVLPFFSILDDLEGERTKGASPHRVSKFWIFATSGFTLEGGVASLQPKGKGALMEKPPGHTWPAAGPTNGWIWLDNTGHQTWINMAKYVLLHVTSLTGYHQPWYMGLIVLAVSYFHVFPSDYYHVPHLNGHVKVYRMFMHFQTYPQASYESSWNKIIYWARSPAL